MSFPRYPAYKDSGVEWLGSLPEDWLVTPIKHFGRLKGGAGFPHHEQGMQGEELAFHKVGGLGQASANGFLMPSENTISRETAERLGAYIFPVNSLVFAKVGAALFLARVRQLAAPACLDNNLMGLVVSDKTHEPAFVRYAMDLVRFDLIANPGAVPSLNEGQIGEFSLASPPTKDEQTCIVQFLDRETAKIDALVAEQEQLISLLKEKRQAVISHAVTKGLNPTVPMKDSGVEWLGAVPAHWGIGKVKKFFATSSGSTPNTDKQDAYYNGDIPWIRSLDLTDGDIVEWEVGITPAAIDDTACKLLPVGTVLVAMYGGDGTIGKNGLLRILAATNQAICALLPSPQFEPEFVLAFMQHQRPYWMVGAEGTRKDPNISQDRVRNALMPCPPLPEQRVIVEHVKQALSAFGSLEKEAEAVIGILNERRSALISAAVTGQIDVRGLAPAQEQAA